MGQYNGTGEVISLILLYLFVAVIAAIVLSIIMWVFHSIALYALSRRRCLGTSAFGWIPILSLIKTGQIADDAAFKGSRKVTHYKVLFPVFTIAGFICGCIGSILLYGEHPDGYQLSFASGASEMSGLTATAVIISLVGTGLAIVGTIFYYICLFYIFRSCSQGYVALLVLGIIFSFLPPFFLFAVRLRTNQEYYPPAYPS